MTARTPEPTVPAAIPPTTGRMKMAMGFATAAIDYPAERFQIQVLDDSTDETCRIVDRVAADLRARGHWIDVVRRPEREGFKAGALEYGLGSAEGEFVAIFDADFVPEPDFLKSLIWTFMRRSRSAIKPASVHIALISAPESSSLDMMNSSRSTSSLKFILVVWMEKILRLVFSSGVGNLIFLSMRPGRIRAGSRDSILLVAMITFTSVLVSKPSSWLSSSMSVR